MKAALRNLGLAVLASGMIAGASESANPCIGKYRLDATGIDMIRNFFHPSPDTLSMMAGHDVIFDYDAGQWAIKDGMKCLAVSKRYSQDDGRLVNFKMTHCAILMQGRISPKSDAGKVYRDTRETDAKICPREEPAPRDFSLERLADIDFNNYMSQYQVSGPIVKEVKNFYYIQNDSGGIIFIFNGDRPQREEKPAVKEESYRIVGKISGGALYDNKTGFQPDFGISLRVSEKYFAGISASTGKNKEEESMTALRARFEREFGHYDIHGEGGVAIKGTDQGSNNQGMFLIGLGVHDKNVGIEGNAYVRGEDPEAGIGLRLVKTF